MGPSPFGPPADAAPDSFSPVHWNRYRPCTAPVQHDQIEYIFCTNIGQFAFCLRCGNDASTNARAVAKVADWRRFLWECCGQVARLCARMRLVFGPEYA